MKKESFLYSFRVSKKIIEKIKASNAEDYVLATIFPEIVSFIIEKYQSAADFVKLNLKTNPEKLVLKCPMCKRPWPKKEPVHSAQERISFRISNYSGELLKDLFEPSVAVRVNLLHGEGICPVCYQTNEES